MGYNIQEESWFTGSMLSVSGMSRVSILNFLSRDLHTELEVEIVDQDGGSYLDHLSAVEKEYYGHIL